MSFILIFLTLAFAENQVSAPIKVDKYCDSDFNKTYFTKKECLFASRSEKCELLAISNKLQLPAAGAGSAVFAGKLFDEYLNRDQKFKEKFLQAIAEMKKARDLKNKISHKGSDFKKEALDEITKGKYKNIEEILADKELKLNERISLISKIDTEATDKMHQAIEKEFGTYYSNPVQKNLNELFPKEMKELKPYYDQKELLRAEFAKPTSTMTFDEIFQKQKKMESDYQSKFSLKLSEKAKLIKNLIEASNIYHNNIVRSSLPSNIFDSAKKIINNEKLANGAKVAGRFAKGAIGGVVLDTTINQTASYLKNRQVLYYLKQCKSTLGLSDLEIDFLGEYNILADQNVMYFGKELIDMDCSKFNLNMSETAVEEAMTHFGGIPAGMCKMMKTESEKIDKLFEGDISKIDCDKNLYISHSKVGDHSLKLFNSQGRQMAYDEQSQWPFSFYLDTNNVNTHFSQKQMITRFSCLVEPQNSGQESQHCAQKQIVSCYHRSDADCKWVSDAAKARVGNLLVNKFCPSSSRPTSDEVSDGKTQFQR